MAKSPSRTLHTALAVSLSIIASGCSLLRASEAPTTPFLSHAGELHSQYNRSPWDAVWSKAPGRIMAQQTRVRRIYVAPINTHFLNLKQDERGVWKVEPKVDAADVKEITDNLRTSFADAIKKAPSTNIQIEERPGDRTLTMEIALTELVPTEVVVNTVANVGALLVPAAKLAENAAVVGGQMASGSLAAGSIAIEMKLIDGRSGEILAEMKDRETDPASILPNYRDFEKYGWSRNTIEAWGEQLVEVFSTPATEKLSGDVNISVVPW